MAHSVPWKNYIFKGTSIHWQYIYYVSGSVQHAFHTSFLFIISIHKGSILKTEVLPKVRIWTQNSLSVPATVFFF